MKEKVKDAKLLPCPFCGGEGVILKRTCECNCFYPRCIKCRAEINDIFESEKEAIEAWNRRYQND